MRWRHLKSGGNLRAKVLGILAGGTIFVIIAVSVLALVARQSDHLLERASTAQRHLELLMLLSGRISDYGLVVLDAVQQPKPNPQKLDAGRARVDAIFEAIEQAIADQVALLPPGDAQSAAATNSLYNARMKAQFTAMHRQVGELPSADASPEDRAAGVRNAMNVFGIQFAPLLAQAVEDQRLDARNARRQMSTLRQRATLFAILWALAALAGSALLYWLAGRPILTRISETVTGATQISSGKLNQRLKPSGRDELTLLMTRFNRMADSFARREAKLLSLQDALQETISERTSDLSLANTRLEEIDANRRRFYSDISHELRTPLTVIIGEAELSLRKSDGLEATTKASLQTIQARANNLRRRVDDLLRIARSESGRLDLDLHKHDLRQVMSDAIDDSASLARTHNVEIDHKPGNEPILISCDSEWLRQSFSGLIANAVKYSPSDTKIAITLKPLKEAVTISIADQGFGISAQDLPKIFDRFYKGQDETHARAGGFGIGLSLVKWVIEEHGGTISAASPTSRKGRGKTATSAGSTFTIRLPLAGA